MVKEKSKTQILKEERQQRKNEREQKKTILREKKEEREKKKKEKEEKKEILKKKKEEKENRILTKSEQNVKEMEDTYKILFSKYKSLSDEQKNNFPQDLNPTKNRSKIIHNQSNLARLNLELVRNGIDTGISDLKFLSTKDALDVENIHLREEYNKIKAIANKDTSFEKIKELENKMNNYIAQHVQDIKNNDIFMRFISEKNLIDEYFEFKGKREEINITGSYNEGSCNDGKIYKKYLKIKDIDAKIKYKLFKKDTS